MLSETTIQTIKASADIVEIISDFVKLKKQGSIYVGLSPFQDERTPSFTIHPAKGIFKDFSSGKGGDVIEFLMQHLSFSYHDSLRYIAKKNGIGMDSDFTYTIPVKPKQEPKPASLIDAGDVEPYLNNFKNNALYKFLANRFGVEMVTNKFNEYYIGSDNTNENTKNWIIFWQVDSKGFVRSGKYIKYLETGKRCKDYTPSWHHMKRNADGFIYKDFNLVQCFFGEHLLLTDIRKPIAIVESEKTAIIASICMPNYFWFACGSKHGLNDVKCEVLNNRSVTLFPDLGAYDEWKEKAKIYGFSISDSIEKIASEDDRKQGLDIADFLLR